MASKAHDFLIGQRNALRSLSVYQRAEGLRVYWFHASSLGEYGIIRPLILALKASTECQVVLTFFSPTGKRAVQPNASCADYVFYLPLGRSQAFLDAIRPDVAIFAVSELWPDYLRALQHRGIPTYLVSAIVRRPSKYFAWYGGMWRRALSRFTHIFVLDEESRRNVQSLGIQQVSVMGDPLFDNAVAVAGETWTDSRIADFCAGREVFIAGSISDERDLQMVADLANRHPELHLIVAPHEVDEESIQRTIQAFKGNVVRYTHAEKPVADAQVLMIDTIGILARLYRYGTYAYVGGGFTPYLHSVIEATVYGLPVSFGPRIERKVTPQQLIARGIGQMVCTSQELEDWWNRVHQDASYLQQTRIEAQAYVEENVGATQQIISQIRHV